jgi:hypothetical protein
MASRSSKVTQHTLFYSYSHKDEKMRDQLGEHLASLVHMGLIKEWHDRKIMGGEPWDDAISEQMERADIILLLISAHFIDSQYMWGKEVTRAIERYNAGKARVIPVILKPADWLLAPIDSLEALPKDGKPVTKWSNRDEAWLDVEQGIRKAAGELSLGVPAKKRKLPASVPVVKKSAPKERPVRSAEKVAKAPRKGLQRIIYSAGNGSEYPGRIVRREGQAPTGDAAVDETYDGLGVCYDFFLKAFQRNSIDGKGAPIEATVHYQQNFDNAFWNGTALILGDGDGKIFRRFSGSLDVLAHTFAHGVVSSMVQLEYWHESGALMESICDVFGALVKQFSLRQAASQADWLIGAGLLGPKIKGTALRSMANPGTAYDDAVLGKDPQPAHMREFVHTDEDSGGVHSNSGIPSRAFYLTATALAGFAWERAGQIWYATLPGLHPRAKFRDFAEGTVVSARKLYGARSDEVLAVKHGWEMVGVRVAK